MWITAGAEGVTMIQLPPSFVTALRTLTALPVWGRESGSFTGSLPYFSSVGLVIGAGQYLAALLLLPVFPPVILAPLLIAYHLLITRAFHLDGLADMADGFGGGWTKERISEIMKDSRVGAFGAISVAALLLVRNGGTVYVLQRNLILYLLYIPMLSRTSLVFTTRVFPYAFEEGLAAQIINGAKWHHFLFNLLPIIVLTLIISPDAYVNILALFAVSTASQIAVGRKSMKKISGISGDILGASLEISEALMYTFMAVLA